jgi:hypothetical protein
MCGGADLSCVLGTLGCGELERRESCWSAVRSNLGHVDLADFDAIIEQALHRRHV